MYAPVLSCEKQNNQPAISVKVNESMEENPTRNNNFILGWFEAYPKQQRLNLGGREGEEGQDLTGNNFKAVIINMLTELKKSFTSEVKEGMANVHQIKNTNKKIEILRKNQM